MLVSNAGIIGQIAKTADFAALPEPLGELGKGKHFGEPVLKIA